VKMFLGKNLNYRPKHIELYSRKEDLYKQILSQILKTKMKE